MARTRSDLDEKVRGTVQKLTPVVPVAQTDRKATGRTVITDSNRTDTRNLRVNGQIDSFDRRSELYPMQHSYCPGTPFEGVRLGTIDFLIKIKIFLI
jgi:hypothetical protein